MDFFHWTNRAYKEKAAREAYELKITSQYTQEKIERLTTRINTLELQVEFILKIFNQVLDKKISKNNKK